MEQGNSNNVISVKIDSSKAFDKLVELRDELDKVNQQIKANKQSSEEEVRQYEQSMAVRANILRQQREVRKQLENEQRSHTQVSTSLKAMRADLSNLRQAYDELSQAEREGDVGKALQEQINSLNDSLLAAEEATGRYQRNVGNYVNGVKEGMLDAFGAINGIFPGFSQSMNDASGIVNTAKKGFEGFNVVLNNTVQSVKSAPGILGKLKAALTSLAVNPIFLVVTAIVAVLASVWKAIKKNQEMVDRLNVAFSAFNPVIDAVEAALQGLAEVVVSLIEGAQKLALAFADVLGLDMAKDFKEKAEAAKELVKAQNSLAAAEVTEIVESAKRKKKLAELEARQREAEVNSKAAAKKFLLEIMMLEKEDMAQKISLAKQKRNLLQQEQDRGTNTLEDNKQMAEAIADVINLETEQIKLLGDQKKKLAEYDKAILEETIKAEDARKKAQEKADQEARDMLQKAISDRIKEFQQEVEARKAADKEMLESLKQRIKAESEATAYANKKEILDMELSGKSKKDIIDRQFKLREKAVAEGLANNAALQVYLEKLYDTQTQATREERDRQLAALDEQKSQGKLRDENAYQESRAALIEQWAAKEKTDKDTHDKEMAELVKSNQDLSLESLQIQLDQKHEKETRDAENFAKLEETKRNQIEATKQAMSAAQNLIQAKTKEGLIAQKTFALAQIAMDQGMAIAKAVKNATEGDPYTIALRVAAAVASVVASMVSAIQSVKSAKFATGGTVRGKGSGTSDDIPIKVSNGEAVMSRRAVDNFAPLLSALNVVSGGAPIESVSPGSSIVQAENSNLSVVDAIRDLHPVVSITDFITAKNQLDSTKLQAIGFID